MRMAKYTAKRLFQLIVVLFGVTFLTFMITQMTPSDPAEMKYVSMGMMPSPAARADEAGDGTE